MYPNLKLQLWRRKMHQNRLAQILEVDETMLSRILNGYRQPTAALRGRIAALLETDESWLFETENGAAGDSRASKGAPSQ